MKSFRRIAAAFLLVLVLVFGAYPYYTGKADYLLLRLRIDIEVNGAVVPGEVLVGRATALLTRRDAGREHSYLLAFEGDVDPTGNEGFAYDCSTWVAPRLPVIIETHHYPPCANSHIYYPLKSSRRFKTGEGDTIGVRANRW